MLRVRFAPSPTGYLHERAVEVGVMVNASRVVLTGQPVGPSAFAVFKAVGGDRAIERLRGA